MVADARIRLEGRLDTVESVIACLQKGCEAARRQHDFALLADAVALDGGEHARKAEAAVRRMAASEPQLAPTLKALDRARWLSAELTVKRARLFRLASMPLHQAVEALAAEPVRFESRVTGLWQLVFVAPVVFVFAVRPHLGLVVMALATLLMVAMAVGCHVPIVVTRRRLVIGHRCFELGEVEKVRIERTMERRFRPVRATVTLANDLDVEVWLPDVDDGLVGALRSSGIQVEAGWRFWT